MADLLVVPAAVVLGVTVRLAVPSSVTYPAEAEKIVLVSAASSGFVLLVEPEVLGRTVRDAVELLETAPSDADVDSRTVVTPTT